MTTTPEPTTAADLPDRLEAALTERFTELGNPFSRMRINFQGPDGWPASKEVGPHDVAEVLRELLAAVPSAPADRAAVGRVRAVLETEAVVGRSALEYRGLIASALMADEAQQPETGEPVKPTSCTWTFEVCYEGDKWHGCGGTYDDSVFDNAHETAQDDFQHRAENDKQRRRFRMIRATTTYAIEAVYAPAAAPQPGAAEGGVSR